MTAHPNILSVEHLSMRFGGLMAVEDLSFDARRGEITALIGPNGAGKTTVFNCITGFYKPTEGMITVRRANGETYLLERLPDFRITREAKVARTFQNIRLFSGMTVLENLLVAQHNKLMVASGYTVLGLLGSSNYRDASKQSIELARHWLEQANLTQRADDPAGDLPYGAQRRLEIARAMCTGPELLCLDEPAAGLNPRESAALNKLLLDIRDQTGTSILLIEHDMSVVMEISDHVVVLEYGKKISDGSPDHVKNDPKVIAAYLGVDDEEVEELLAGKPADAEIDADAVAARLIAEETGLKVAAGGAPKAARGKTAASPSKAGAKSGAKSATGKTQAARKQASRASAPVPAPAASATAATAKADAAKPARAKTASAKSASAKPEKGGTARTATAKTDAAKPAPAKASAAKPSTAKPSPAKPSTAKASPAKAAKAKAAPAKAAAPADKPQATANALAAPRGGQSDNLTLIKGIGKVNERKLNEHGIFHFDQIAAWKKADVVLAEKYLAFDGRIAREDWIRQARQLAAGKSTEFSKRAAAGKVESSRAGTAGRGAARKPRKGDKA
jgi:ABC-type branched-subunit amino acid transport system ATPase component/predicted flap endonuclease-1-like 5' DNA nuclease